MKRTPLKRSGPLKRTKKITAKKRTAADFRRIYGSKARVAWVKSLPCFNCFSYGEIHNAHITAGGTGRKASADKIIPLCPTCHDLQHRKGWDALEMPLEMRQELARLIDDSWKAMQERAL